MPVRDILNAASSQGAGPSDPYFYDVSLLLNGDGTNGAQNNTFLDSSSNAFTITRNGNTTQGSFSPYGTLWSNYFNGSSSLRGGSSISTGTGDYTVECWANMPSPGSNSNGNIFITIGDEQTGTGCCFYQYNNSVRMYGAVLSGAPRMNVSYTFSPNVWYHIAFVRSGSTTTAYVNGTSIGTATVSATGNAFSGNPYVSEILDTGNFYKGDACYISNLRVTQSALYTSNFTPSTTPLTAISGVQFLTSQSNRFIDNSSNNVALTASGSPSVQRFSPFNPTAPYDTATIGGSGYFDYSGSYLSVADNTAMTLTGDSTIEAFVYLNSYNGSYSTVVARWQASGTEEEFLFWIDSSGTPQFYFKPFGSGTPLLSGGTAPLNSWVHLAVVRSSNSWALFVNGTRTATATNSGVYSDTTATTTIGSIRPTYTSYDLKGYVTNVRLVKGTAIYSPSSTTITVPTAPLTNVSGTSLLCNMTNAGIPDLAMQNDLQTVGNAQVSTSVKKYGTGSLAFDGTGDWLLTSPEQPLNFGTGDFTAECWVYTASSSLTFPFSQTVLSTGRNGIAFGWGSTSSYYWLFGDGSNWVFERQPSGTLTTNTWIHLAVVRDNGTARFYVNGVQIDSIANTTNLTQSSNVSYIGGNPAGYNLNGYIDDLRITTGYCRYPNGTTFTPPTAALPTY